MIIQAGLIQTSFADTAAAQTPARDGPYTQFNATVATATREAYERGALAKLGGPRGGCEILTAKTRRAAGARRLAAMLRFHQR